MRSTSPALPCRKGWGAFPAARLDGPELDLRLLVKHRERLIRHRVKLNSTLLWQLHDLWPELQLPGGALVLVEVERTHLPAPGPGRADDARPDRTR